MTNTAAAPVRTAAAFLEFYRNDDRITRVATALHERAAGVQIDGSIGSAQG